MLDAETLDHSIQVPSRKSPAPCFLRGIIFSIATLSLTTAGTVSAQNILRPLEQALPAGQSSNVYLNDSFEAADAIQRAKRLVEKRQWREAVDLIVEVSDEAEDKLIRVGDDRFVGVREYINDWIAKWPIAGLDVYRNRIDPKAQEAINSLKRSQRMDAYVSVFDRYFCTPSAAKLADTIGQLALESGNLSLARSAYRRVLDHHPDRASFAKPYQSMLLILDAIEGIPPDPATAPDPADKIRWMGQERHLREVLSEIAQTYAGIREAPPAVDWPMAAGDMTRARINPTQVDDPGLLWATPIAGAGSAPRRDADREDGAGTRSSTRSLSIQPVIAEGLVYIQTGREVSALHRNTGAVAWRFRADDVSSAAPQERDDVPAGWDSPTAQNGRLYIVLPSDGGSSYTTEAGRPAAEIVALDATSGRLLWRTADQLRLDRSSELGLDSSLLVRGNRVYAVGRRRRSFGFEDCYLYAFDAAGGSLLYRTHLGSASTGTLGSRTATMSLPAVQGDTIYVCTNLGAVAAVAASTGNVLWLRIYPRDATSAGQSGGWAARERFPWEVNPTVLSNQHVVCLPSDSQHILVLSVTDGELIKSIPLAELGGAQTLLGVRDDLACTAGVKVACLSLSDGHTRFASELPTDNALFGRGTWAGDQLWIPTRTHLYRFDVADGRRTDHPWSQDAEPGNIVATEEQVFVAGGKTITAYVRKSEIWNALRGRMTANPADPVPALELAEVALRSGDLKEALEALDEAVRRAGGFAVPLDGPLSKRFFDAVLAFVDVLASRSKLEPDILDKLFEYASSSAPDPAAHVSYRLRFGWIFETRTQSPKALSLYQQILRDRSLRDTETPAAGHLPQHAAVIARARIAALIEREGPSVFAPYEAEARRWLENARATRDPAALIRIVETFPNSDAAPLAYIANADLVAESGRFEEAARWYARAYHQYPRMPDRPELMRKIADGYEHAGKREHAYRWLTKASREYPSARIEVDGKTWTFTEYRERLADVRNQLEPSRPKIALPLSEGFVRTFDGNVALLTPRFGDDPLSRWSRAFVYTPGQLRAMNVRDGTDLWPEPVEVPVRPDLLIATDELAVFSTTHGVIALDAATGTSRWKLGTIRAAREDPNADWEDGQTYRNVIIAGGRLIAVRDDGQVTSIELSSGKTLWSRAHRPVTSGHIRAADRWIVYPVVQDEQVVICLLDAATGDWQDAILTGEDQAVEDLFVTLDGQVLLVTMRSILLYDLETRALRWRLPVDGRIRRETLDLDMDALYFSDDAVSLEKVGLEDGTILWRSDRLLASRDDDLTVDRQGNSLIVSSISTVTAVDAGSGQTLWKGTAPKDARFLRRAITDAYLVALQIPHPPVDDENKAYFYDHRNASGILPRDGGVLPLGALPDMRAVLPADNTLLIQTGSAIEGWTKK